MGIPKMDGLQWKVLLRRMICGYPHDLGKTHLAETFQKCALWISQIWGISQTADNFLEGRHILFGACMKFGRLNLS